MKGESRNVEVTRVLTRYQANVPIEAGHFEIIYEKDQRKDAGALSGVKLLSATIYLWRKGDSVPFGIKIHSSQGQEEAKIMGIPGGMMAWIEDEMRTLREMEK